MVKRKKALLVLLEGGDDLLTVMKHVESIIDDNESITSSPKIIGYDITNCVSYNNIVIKLIDHTNLLSVLAQNINLAIRENHLKKQDILEVVLISDIDGAFLDNDLIVDGGVEKITYYTDWIEAKNKNDIVLRNERKRRNIKQLCNLSKVCGLDFHFYYWSCNMEHVLYNKINLKQDEKDCYATKNKKVSKEDFLKAINDLAVQSSTDYYESWDELMQIKDFIPRKNNVNIFFDHIFELINK